MKIVDRTGERMENFKNFRDEIFEISKIDIDTPEAQIILKKSTGSISEYYVRSWFRRDDGWKDEYEHWLAFQTFQGKVWKVEAMCWVGVTQYEMISDGSIKISFRRIM